MRKEIKEKSIQVCALQTVLRLIQKQIAEGALTQMLLREGWSEEDADAIEIEVQRIASQLRAEYETAK